MSKFNEPIHIVVAEVDALTRTLTSRILTSSGFIIKEASIAEDAYKAIDRQVKLILVDIGLPNFNGMELTKRLRRRYPKECLKICLATALTDKDTIAKCVDLGGDDFMVKPIDKDILLQKVTKLLGQESEHCSWVVAECAATVLDSAVQPDLKVVRVSESGLMLKSSARIVLNSAIRIQSPALSHALGCPIENVIQKVTICEKQSGTYFICTEFVGLTEDIAQPLRGVSARGQFIKEATAIKVAS